MGLDQYGMIRNKEIDFKKVYSDDYNPIEDGFVWRKHARLQVFMAREFAKQNPKEKTDEHSSLNGLGFNGEEHKVIITEDVLKRLEEAIKSDYFDYFATDGFFWVNNTKKNKLRNIKNKISSF